MDSNYERILAPSTKVTCVYAALIQIAVLTLLAAWNSSSPLSALGFLVSLPFGGFEGVALLWPILGAFATFVLAIVRSRSGDAFGAIVANAFLLVLGQWLATGIAIAAFLVIALLTGHVKM